MKILDICNFSENLVSLFFSFIKHEHILFVKLNKFQFSLLVKVPIFTFLIRKFFHGDL